MTHCVVFLLLFGGCFACVLCSGILSLHVIKKPKLNVSKYGKNITSVSAVDCYNSCLASDECISANLYCTTGEDEESAGNQCTCEMFSDIALSENQLINAKPGQFYIRPGEI